MFCTHSCGKAIIVEMSQIVVGAMATEQYGNIVKNLGGKFNGN
jgi:hypothetical protein